MKKFFTIFAVIVVAIVLIFAFVIKKDDNDQIEPGQAEQLTWTEYEEAVNELRLQQLQAYEIYVVAFTESHPEVYEEDIWKLILMVLEIHIVVEEKIDNLEKPE